MSVSKYVKHIKEDLSKQMKHVTIKIILCSRENKGTQSLKRKFCNAYLIRQVQKRCDPPYVELQLAIRAVVFPAIQ